jgi:hypothetical protein
LTTPTISGLVLRFSAEACTPVDALSRIRRPFLAVLSPLDPLLPAHTSAELVSDALHAASDPDVTVVIFRAATNGCLRPGTNEFVAGYPDLLTDWAARRGFLKG